MVALLDLESFLQTPVRQLSLGQRMRGDLAAAMLYEPRILYLDEPTVGLDVVAKERTRQFVEETNRKSGTTVILTTHDLADVERLCKRIVFISQGTVLYDGPVDELTRRYAPYRQGRVHPRARWRAIADRSWDRWRGGRVGRTTRALGSGSILIASPSRT